MADFSLSQIQEVSSAPVGVQRPVPEPSGAEAALGLFSGLLSSAATSGPTAAQRAAAAKEQKLSVAGTEFTQLQLEVAQAVDRGDLSSQEARMRMRSNYATAIANNPDLTSELASIHKNVIGTAGLGRVAQEGTSQEQAFQKAQEQATLAGWVTADMSQEDAQEATTAHIRFNRQQEEIDAQQNEIALRRAQLGEQSDRIGLSTSRIGNQSARLNLEQKQNQVRSQNALKEMASSYHVKFRNDTNAILRQLENGDIDDRTALDMLDGQWATLQSVTNQVGSDAGADYSNSLIAPMKFLYESAKERASGELDNDLYQNRVDKAIGLQTLELTADPRNTRAIAVSRLLPNADITNYTAVESAAIRMMGNNSREDGPPSNLVATDEPDQVPQYLQIIKSNLRADSEGALLGGEEASKEIDTNLNQILKGVSAFSTAVDSPDQYNQVVEFLSSADYGDYVVRHGTGINQENSGAASQTLQQQYIEEVLPLVREEWDNAQVTTSTLPTSPTLGTVGTEEDVSGALEPVWSGAGISFVAKDRSNTRLNAKARTLNKKVAPVMNRLIRMSAHLEGHKNYKQMYEGNYATIFRSEQETDE